MGLHHITYGARLEEKFRYIEKLVRLRPNTCGEFKLSFDYLMEVFPKMQKEAKQSFMAFVVCSYLDKYTDLTLEEIDQTTRVMIAVSEAEACQVFEVMEKYTHPELQKKYEKLTGEKIDFKLLDEYDEYQLMLHKIGLFPLQFHHHVSKTYFPVPKKQADNKKPISGRGKMLEKALDMTAQSIKSSRAD